MKLRGPNTFIVGAPKSGTTSLFHYLSQHPNVFTTHPKEPHYFATDLPGSRFVTNEKAYRYLFKDAKPHHQILCEGSVLYAYSKDAIPNIYRFNPQAKLIIMLRNPVDLLPSMHSELVYGLEESKENFEEAWNLNPLRKQRQSIPKHNREPKLLFYDEIAKHGEHYERLLTYFPKEQICLIFFETFTRDTEACYQRVLEFLDLPFHKVDLSPLNENKVHRNPQIAHFLQRPPSAILKPYLRVKKLLGLEHKHLGLRNPFLKANTLHSKRNPLTPELQNEIIKTYKDDILKLSELSGQNLDHWLYSRY